VAAVRLSATVSFAEKGECKEEKGSCATHKGAEKVSDNANVQQSRLEQVRRHTPPLLRTRCLLQAAHKQSNAAGSVRASFVRRCWRQWPAQFCAVLPLGDGFELLIRLSLGGAHPSCGSLVV